MCIRDRLNIKADNFQKLVGKDAEYNSQKIIEIFKGEDNDFSKAVSLNAAAGLIVSEKETNFKNAYEQNPRLRFFASRKQVFFINRDILTSWDPWLRRLVSQISCGTTTTPNRWGILKCILRSNPGGQGFSSGMEFPAIPDSFYGLNNSEASPPYDRTVGCSRTPTGGISIEVGQLQIILLLAIKTRLAQMGGYLPGGDRYPYSSSVDVNYNSFHRNCDDTCHDYIKKNVIIDYAPAMAKRGRIQEEEIIKQGKSGIYDMIFNCSGKTLGAQYKEASVSVSYTHLTLPTKA